MKERILLSKFESECHLVTGSGTLPSVKVTRSQADMRGPCYRRPMNVRFTPKADIGTQPRDVHFVPQADIAARVGIDDP
jgi:hypothetical protein